MPVCRAQPQSHDVLALRLFRSAGLDQSVAPVAVGCLLVGTNGDGLGEPLSGVIGPRHTEAHVASEESGGVIRAIELRSALIGRERRGVVALGKRSFTLVQCLAHFGADPHDGKLSVGREILQHHRKIVAVVAELFGTQQNSAGAKNGLLSDPRIGDPPRRAREGAAQGVQHQNVAGISYRCLLEQGQGVRLVALLPQFKSATTHCVVVACRDGEGDEGVPGDDDGADTDPDSPAGCCASQAPTGRSFPAA
jgi:hypothetical protein